MSVFLAPHLFGDLGYVIPAAGGLRDGAAIADDVDLAFDFVLQGFAGAAEGVHVLDLDLAAEFGAALGADGDVHVATHHSLFHVAFTDAAVDEDVLEGVEIGVGHVRTGDAGFGDDLEQGDAGTVEIDAAELVEMKALADVFL